MVYLCILLGILAASLSPSNKRAMCLAYVLGLLSETVLTSLYEAVGAIESAWDSYYSLLALIDLYILFIMYQYYHRDYILIFPVVLLMVLVNASIVLEWTLLKSTALWEVSEGLLLGLNVAALLLLLGASDGILRVMDDLRARLFPHRKLFINRALRVRPGERIGSPVQTGEGER